MNARPYWSIEDINPAVRERAEASARRSGLSFSEWLNAMIGDETQPAKGRGLLDRIDPFTRELNDPPSPSAPRKVAEDSIASRGARLAHSEPANGLYRQPSISAPEPGSLEAAIAEISARQFDLDVRSGQDVRFQVPSAKLSKLEQQITRIMRQVETLPSAGAIEQSIELFRAELSEMRHSITDAMPRRALETLEAEIRALTHRIDVSRDNGADRQALAGVEQSLEEIRGTLRGLTPAEQLAGYDEAIRKLTIQLDQIARDGSEDRAFVRKLEDAIAALRVIVSNIASDDALATLGEQVRTLAAKLDRFGQSDRTALVVDTAQVEDALRALSQRMDRLPSEFAASADYGDLDRRVSSLLDRLESAPGSARDDADHTIDRPGRERAGLDPELVEAIKREIAEMRFNLTANDRHTQDSLEVVNSTLGHVVDRLATIEGDLRTAAWSAPVAAPPPVVQPIAPSIQPSEHGAEQSLAPVSSRIAKPELPNPAASLASHATRALQDAAEAGNHRAPIVPNLPPDFPLEPGSLTAATSAPEASADGIELDAAAPEGDAKLNFIAAARRAARAASEAAEQPDKGRFAKPAKNAESGVTAKIRSLLVGASVVVIVLGSVRMAVTLFEGIAANSETSAAERSVAPPSEAPASTAQVPGKQSSMLSIPIPQQDARSASPGDITGSLGALPLKSQASIPAGETLPDAIGSVRLREAALKGNAGAAYEIATRFAEGRGVTADFTEAAKWYDRAAQAGIVPAMFRFGALYEKGIGVKKDLDAARRYYSLAADRGNAKAMHNLAVLEADGGTNGANFKAAGGWFRKAAERGVVDSQYNLGILYARGIGVEQNLAESYKWFSLAAAQGDADSNSKRDDVAKRLDPQSLAAAKLATQTFTAEPQPALASDVGAAAGGWDAIGAQTANAAPPAKVTTSRRAAGTR